MPPNSHASAQGAAPGPGREGHGWPFTQHHDPITLDWITRNSSQQDQTAVANHRYGLCGRGAPHASAFDKFRLRWTATHLREGMATLNP